MDESIGALSLRELGGRLIKTRSDIDAAEAQWLELLARFDSLCGFVIDGHHNSVSWLIDNCGMAYSTAKDRLRVAKELQRRPRLFEGLAQGRVSYAKIKVLTRMTGLGDESGRVFLQAADTHTASELERLYRHYKLNEEQDTPPPGTSGWERCGVRTLHRSNRDRRDGGPPSRPGRTAAPPHPGRPRRR